MKKVFLTLGAVLVFGIASAQINQSTTTPSNRLTVQQKPAKSLNTNADPASTSQSTESSQAIYGAPSTNNGPTMSNTTATGNAGNVGNSGNTVNNTATTGTATASPGTGATGANTAAPASATSTKTTTTTATAQRRN